MTNDTYYAKEKYFGNVATGYDERRTKNPRWEREQKVVAAYVAAIKQGSTVLDVPFGTGRYVECYLERGLKVMGADISADMIAAAAKRLSEEVFGQLDVRFADAEHLPFDDGAADVVVCTRFIKWLPSLDIVDNVIGEFARVCHGRMLIQVKVTADGGPNARGPMGLIKHRLWRLRDGLRAGLSALSGRASRKTRRYRDVDVRAIFARRGLEVIDAFDDAEESCAIRYYVLQNRSGGG